MGGIASPLIADLYLSCYEHCYMSKIDKTDYAIMKLLSYSCRYLEDICTVNFKYFGDNAKDIYDSTLLLEGNACSYKQDAVLGLYIRVVDGKFVTGISQKIDDFNFWVINYPFSQHSIHSMLGYTTFYHNSSISLDFVTTSMVSCFEQNLAIPSWSSEVTCIAPCLNILKYSVWPTKYMKNMARKIIIYYSRVWSNTASLFRVI